VLPQSDWIRRDELKDLSDTLQKIKFDAGRTGAPRPSAATMMGAGFMGGGGQTPYMAAGLNDPHAGHTTQAGWSGRPGAGMQGGPQVWPPAPPGGFTPGSQYYGYDGSYGTPYGQTPGQQHIHPNYSYGVTPGQNGQYLAGMQGQIGGHPGGFQGQMGGYPGYGHDTWHDSHEQYRPGHGDAIEGMESFFMKINDYGWSGNKATPAAKPSPHGAGRGNASISGGGTGPNRSGTAGADGGVRHSAGQGAGAWSSSEYFDDSEESRYAEDRGYGKHRQSWQPQQHPPHRKSKDHRGVSAIQMQNMFSVLVRLEVHFFPILMRSLSLSLSLILNY
jgi:hypothetical protein